MEVGASLEARRPKQFAVGAALERVQGSDRLMLEQFRRQGRAAEALEQNQQIRGQYEQRAESDSRFLRDPTVLSQPIERQPVRAAAPSEGNPFADEAPKPQPSAEKLNDPFATDDGGAAASQERGGSTKNGKTPPSKLMGVLGRVLQRTVPLPSIDGLRNQLPQTSAAPSDGTPANNAEPGTKQNTTPSQPNNSEDPFGGP
jgi:hypothetical protein